MEEGGFTVFNEQAEDVLIQEYLGIKNNITSFIDIGANDGIKYSNVYKFAKDGSCGLSFEPIPSIFRKLKENYKDFKCVHCINKAVSNKNDNIVMVDAGVLSHITETADEGLTCNVINTPQMPAQPVWVDTINAREVSYIWNQKFQHGTIPDFVSIDVEGHEHVILDNWDSDFLPKAFIIETHCYDENGKITWLHQHYNDILAQLISNFGYDLVTTTRMNTIFVK
jgi:FkbM family methyltransferase